MREPPLILVVDDTPTDALLLSRALSKSGYDVLIAHDSDTCFSCHRQSPTLSFLTHLPGRDGLETCRLSNRCPVCFDPCGLRDGSLGLRAHRAAFGRGLTTSRSRSDRRSSARIAFKFAFAGGRNPV
jgi:hypothetical protein